MAAKKKASPPDLDLELNQILSLKEDLRQSIGNGGSVDMMLNSGRGHGSLRDSSLLYADAVAGDGGSLRNAGSGSKTSSIIRRWAESFHRDPKGRMTPKHAFVGGRGRNYYDLRAANYRTAHSLLAKELKGRHLQMIAIGGSIGELRDSVCVCGLALCVV